MDSWKVQGLSPVILIEAGEDILGDWAISHMKELAHKRDVSCAISTLSAIGYKEGTLSELCAPSLFGEPRLVILDHAERANAQLSKEVQGLLTAMDDDVTLVLRLRSAPVGSAKVMITAARGAINSGRGEVVSLPTLKKPVEQLGFLRSLVRSQSRTASPGALQALVDALGADNRELIAFTMQLLEDTSGKIDEAIVSQYWGGRANVTRYAIADAVVAGDLARSLSLVRQATATGMSPVAIIASVTSRLRTLAAVRRRGAIYGADSPAFAQIHGWIGQRAAKEGRAWSGKALGVALTALARADAQVKGESRDKQYALEAAIREATQARATYRA